MVGVCFVRYGAAIGTIEQLQAPPLPSAQM